MYVNSIKHCPQIEYNAWSLDEAAKAEASDLARLKQRYLTTPEERPPGEARENLQLFYEDLFKRYTSGIKISPAVPETMQRALRRDFLVFDRTSSLALATATDSGKPRMSRVGEAFVQSSSRLSNILLTSDQSFRSFIALNACTGYSKYLFVSERTERSCLKCESLHGRLFTLEDLKAPGLIPPLHPNCKCKLFAIDAATEYVYNLDRESFIHQLDRFCDEGNLSDGGVYICPRDALGEISARALRVLMPMEYPAITDRENSAPRWYESIRDWAVKFWADFSGTVDAFFERSERLFVNADEMMDKNPLLGLLHWADALSFGIVSGIYENFQRNYEIYISDPNAYSLLNLYTHGLVEMVTGAVFPEEFLSFEHLMDAVGAASLLYGAASLLEREGGLDGAARAALAVPDTLDDLARRNGKITEVLSADKLNEARKKRGYEPPYKPGSKVFRVKFDGNTKFVRVFDGVNSKPSGKWFMNADDVEGLTAMQIGDKFSLPQLPTGICDVVIPSGTTIEISIAGGVMGGSGGKVQYRFVSKYDENWFINGRLLP